MDEFIKLLNKDYKLTDYLIKNQQVVLKLNLAEGSVNKIKLIKRIMYGRNSFELLKSKILLQEQLHYKFN